jgi:hypothetical protein
MRICHLQVELSEASQEKGLLDTKLVELDQLVAQLLSLNESLVLQLSGRPLKGGLLSSALKGKLKKRKDKEKAPRAAALSTAASDGNKTTKYLARPNSQLIPVKSNDVEQMKAMHKMFASMAKSLRKSNNSSHLKSRPSPSQSQSQSQSQSGKKSSVFSSHSVGSAGSDENGRAATRMSRKKSSRASSDEDASSHPSSRPHPREVRLPKPTVTFDASDGELAETSYLGMSSSERGRSPPSRSTASSSKDMQTVIASLEDEFDGLNRQYRRLLTDVQASNTVTGGSVEQDVLSAEHIQAQAEEIVNVIQKLHQKGEQLRMLKSPPR